MRSSVRPSQTTIRGGAGISTRHDTTTVQLEGSYDIGERVHDFELPTTGGDTYRLSDHRGPTLVFLTTTWCPDCSAEAPYLEQEIWRRYRDRGLQVIAIQVKEGDALAGAFAESTTTHGPFSATAPRR